MPPEPPTQGSEPAWPSRLLCSRCPTWSRRKAPRRVHAAGEWTVSSGRDGRPLSCAGPGTADAHVSPIWTRPLGFQSRWQPDLESPRLGGPLGGGWLCRVLQPAGSRLSVPLNNERGATQRKGFGVSKRLQLIAFTLAMFCVSRRRQERGNAGFEAERETHPHKRRQMPSSSHGGQPSHGSVGRGSHRRLQALALFHWLLGSWVGGVGTSSLLNSDGL